LVDDMPDGGDGVTIPSLEENIVLTGNTPDIVS
jgi:hypothetical protein